MSSDDKNQDISNIVDVEKQINRLEDLIKFYIWKRKDALRFYSELAQEKLSQIEFIRKTIVSGFVGLISILLALTAISQFDKNIIIPLVIVLIIITVLSHWLNLRNHRQAGNYFGEALSAIDVGIKNLEKVQEILIISSLDSYKGEPKVIKEIGTFVLILERFNLLYLAKPWSKLTKINAIDKDTRKTLLQGSSILSGELEKIIVEYNKLDKKLIHESLQELINSVIDDLKSE